MVKYPGKFSEGNYSEMSGVVLRVNFWGELVQCCTLYGTATHIANTFGPENVPGNSPNSPKPSMKQH